MSRIFGAVCQNGYIVRDIRAAMDHWVNVMGVGPWYYIDKVKTDYFRHRGQDSAMEMSVALANSGDLQIELIQQRNDAPSMYKEFLDSGREGLQHMSYWTRDYQALYDRALSLGYKIGHEARSAAKRVALPISIRRPIPAPWWRFRTSAAARGVSSSTSARSPPVGTAPIPSAKSADAERCVPSSPAPTVPF